MNDNHLKNMRSDVDSMLKWKTNNSLRQITLSNFGVKSKSVMRKNHLVATGKTANLGFGADTSIEVKVDNDSIFIPVITSI